MAYSNGLNTYSVTELEEPYEGGLSRTGPWEPWGGTPRYDRIGKKTLERLHNLESDR